MITIKKAIEVLEINLKEAGDKMPGDCYDSVELGIEAMKTIYNSRIDGDLFAWPLLKGEQKE